MGIEHIMASPGHHQTNGQAELNIRELKTALRNVVNLRQTNWLISLPEMAAYSNAGHSDTINISPYKAYMGETTPSWTPTKSIPLPCLPLMTIITDTKL